MAATAVDLTAELDGRDLLDDWFRAVAAYPLLSVAEEQELAVAKAAGDAEAFERLYLCNQRLVISVAKRFVGHGVDLADLIAEGRIGLRRAIEKFAPASGHKLSTYATYWIRQRCERALIYQGEPLPVPVYLQADLKRLRAYVRLNGMALDASVDSSVAGMAAETGVAEDKVRDLLPAVLGVGSLNLPVRSLVNYGEADVERQDLVADESAWGRDPLLLLSSDAEAARETLAYLLDERHAETYGGRYIAPGVRFVPLSERERQVLHLRYLAGEDPQPRQEDVARRLGVTHQAVSLWELRAIAKLRQLAALLGVTDPMAE